MELTIGILSFNTRELTLRCIRSIKRFTKGVDYKIIVVDNASQDGSAVAIKKEFPDIKLISNRKNNYFAAGYNQIIRITNSKYLLMLNSDTYIKDNAFKKILEFMKKNKLTACEGLEIKPDGKTIPTGSKFRSLRSDFYELSIIGKLLKNKKYLNKVKMKNYDRKDNFSVEVGCNAFFCIETSLLKKIGMFDENFILYFTEDDLCQRIKMKGYEIFHYGKSFVIHEDAKSAIQLGWARYNLYYRDMLTYHLKYSNKVLSIMLFCLLKIENSIFYLKSKISNYLGSL